MINVDPRWIITTIVALLTGGGWAFLQGLMQARRKPEVASKDGMKVADQVDASILAVARARDELEQENARLRKVHRTEREEWEAEKVLMRTEIDRLMSTIRHERETVEEERRQAAMRYDLLLEQLNTLREQIRTAKEKITNGEE